MYVGIVKSLFVGAAFGSTSIGAGDGGVGSIGFSIGVSFGFSTIAGMLLEGVGSLSSRD